MFDNVSILKDTVSFAPVAFHLVLSIQRGDLAFFSVVTLVFYTYWHYRERCGPFLWTALMSMNGFWPSIAIDDNFLRVYFVFILTSIFQHEKVVLFQLQLSLIFGYLFYDVSILLFVLSVTISGVFIWLPSIGGQEQCCLSLLLYFIIHSRISGSIHARNASDDIKAIVFSSLSLLALLCSMAATVKCLDIVYHATKSSRLKIFVFLIISVPSFYFMCQRDATRWIGTDFATWLLGLLTGYNSRLILRTCALWIILIVIAVWFADIAVQQFGMSKVWGRKIFHFLVVLMFTPVIATQELRAFMNLGIGGALCAFVLMEFARLYLFSSHSECESINRYFEQFLPYNERLMARNQVVTTHISLLVATGSTIWVSSLLDFASLTTLSSHGPILAYFGLITVGIGDSFAAIIGSKFGKWQWPESKKTILGTVSGFISMVVATYFLTSFYNMNVDWKVMVITLLMTSLAEVFVEGNDNLTMPIYSTTMYLVLKQLMFSF